MKKSRSVESLGPPGRTVRTSPNPRGKGILVLSATLLGMILFLFLLLWGEGREEKEPSVPPETPSKPGSSPLSGRKPPPRPARKRIRIEGEAAFLVMDAGTGSPLPGAHIHGIETSNGIILAERPLGETDGKGRFHLDPATIKSLSGVEISKRGYASNQVPAEKIRHENLVRLEPGFPFKVLVTDRKNNPIQGFKVFLSSMILDPREGAASLCSRMKSFSSVGNDILMEETDRNGIATFEGLPMGKKYPFIWGFHPGYILLKGYPREPIVIPRDTMINLSAVEVLVAAGSVEGDRIVSVQWDPISFPIEDGRAYYFINMEMDRIKSSLKRRFPNSFFLLLPAKGRERSQREKAVFRVLLRASGWKRFTLPFRRLATFKEPTRLPVDASGCTPPATRKVMILVLNNDGTPLFGNPRLSFSTSQKVRRTRFHSLHRLWISAGKPSYLPPGTYKRIGSEDRVLAQALKGISCTIDPGIDLQEITLRLRSFLVAVEVDVSSKGSRPLGGIALQAGGTHGEGPFYDFFSSRRRALLYLPRSIKTAWIRVSSNGYRTTKKIVDLTKHPKTGKIKLQVTIAHK